MWLVLTWVLKDSVCNTLGSLEHHGVASGALRYALKDLLEEDVHGCSAAHVLAEEGLKHAGVRAEQGGQTHEQPREVHWVGGSGHPHVLVQQLLDDGVELVNGAGAGQSRVTSMEKDQHSEVLVLFGVDLHLLTLPDKRLDAIHRLHGWFILGRRWSY